MVIADISSNLFIDEDRVKTLNSNAALIDRLSARLHERQSFAGMEMATILLTRNAQEHSSELEVLYIKDGSDALKYLSRDCASIKSLICPAEPHLDFRFVIPHKFVHTSTLGIALGFDAASLAVILWADLGERSSLLNMLSEAIREERNDLAMLKSPLSARERQMVALIADGLTSSEIATRCSIAESTVTSYIKNTLIKLKARSRAQLVAIAIRDGWI